MIYGSIDSFGSYSLTEEYYDYRESIKINKPMQYRSRISHEFTNYDNQPLEAVVSYKGTSVNAEDHEFAPSLILDFDSIIYARLSVEKNKFSFSDGEGGLGYNPSITPLLNTWYDLRIQLRNNDLMNGYLLSYSFKLISEGLWTELATYTLTTSVSGTPTAVLGTHNNYGEDNLGGTDTYHFSDFMIRTLTDQDSDGLTDQEEYDLYQSGVLSSTSMFLYDTDGDGLSDAEELSIDIQDLNYTTLKIDGVNSYSINQTGTYNGIYHSNPLVADTDGDGLNDLDEKMFGSNPNNDDTDLDGVLDGQDSEPTVFDTFAPSYVNINGSSFVFGDGTELHPLEVNASDGVYLYIEEVSGNIYMVMEFHDDRGLDNVHIWSTGGIAGSGDFDTTISLTGYNDISVLYQVNVPDFVLQTHTIHIQAEDVDGHVTDDFTYVIESTFSKYAGPVIDFLQFGANWIVDKVGDFIDWVSNTVSEALEYALDWLKDKASKVLKFINSKISGLIQPIQESGIQLITRLFVSISNYQQGTINDIYDEIVTPFASSMQTLIDFATQYETELDWIQKSMDIVFSVTTPLGFASLLLNVVGDSAYASNYEIFTVIDNMSSAVGSWIATSLDIFMESFNMDYTLGGMSISDFPSDNNIENFYNDMPNLGVDAVLYDVVEELILGLGSIGTNSNLQLNAEFYDLNNPTAKIMAVVGLIGLLIKKIAGTRNLLLVFGLYSMLVSFSLSISKLPGRAYIATAFALMGNVLGGASLTQAETRIEYIPGIVTIILSFVGFKLSSEAITG
ncbi:MAG: hypothetical protein HeimC2_21410 [Candidatus Heimdallarchaeota archaeon LC_2]|nr:MAG: hypothetical protein HeimC2_21410 [Candidatus Heimdallarchaeota archaeon LC_2]